MAFKTGDLITADLLNSTNASVSQNWSWGHNGWTWGTRQAFWYCTRASGVAMMTQSNTTSSGNQKKLTLYRLENGTWTQKNYSDTASDTKTISWNSYGIGAYYLNIYDHNNTPSLQVWPSSVNCTRGKLLVALSRAPTGNDEASVKAMSARSVGRLLTASILNSGDVYTL